MIYLLKLFDLFADIPYAEKGTLSERIIRKATGLSPYG
jgi:hypothetical protein